MSEEPTELCCCLDGARCGTWQRGSNRAGNPDGELTLQVVEAGVLLHFLRLLRAGRRDLCPCFGLGMKEQHLLGPSVTMAVGVGQLD